MAEITGVKVKCITTHKDEIINIRQNESKDSADKTFIHRTIKDFMYANMVQVNSEYKGRYRLRDITYTITFEAIEE